jgi:hypothetical protein
MTGKDDFRDDAEAPVGPRTREYLRALQELVLAMGEIVEFHQRLDGLAGRGDSPERVGEDPGDLRDRFSRLQASLGALVPRVAVAAERTRAALRKARAAWVGGAEAEPVGERRRLAAEYARLADALQDSGSAGSVRGAGWPAEQGVAPEGRLASVC